MEANEIRVKWNWVDDEIAFINCPYCKEELTITIYAEDLEKHKCKCGRKFLLHQRNWVTEDLTTPATGREERYEAY